jgi:hypothetical protein
VKISSDSDSERKRKAQEAKKKTQELFTPYRKDPVRKLTPVEGIAGKEVGKEVGKEDNDVDVAGKTKGSSLRKVGPHKELPTKASLQEEVPVKFRKLTC